MKLAVVTHELPPVNGLGVKACDLYLATLRSWLAVITVSENEVVFTASALDRFKVYGSHVVDMSANKIRWDL